MLGSLRRIVTLGSLRAIVTLGSMIAPRATVSLCAANVWLGSCTRCETGVSGVPSTGQKLNLSANSSSHLEQNFIDTTSSRLWVSSTDCDSPSALENSLAKLFAIRLSRTLEGPGAFQRSSTDFSSSSETNSFSGSTPISGLLQSNNFPTTIQLPVTA